MVGLQLVVCQMNSEKGGNTNFLFSQFLYVKTKIALNFYTKPETWKLMETEIYSFIVHWYQFVHPWLDGLKEGPDIWVDVELLGKFQFKVQDMHACYIPSVVSNSLQPYGL